MNILVTGGLGVNGVWVVRRLVELGYRPVVFDKRLDTAFGSDNAKKMDLVKGDIQDISDLRRVIKKFHVKRIVHLAALMSDAARTDPLSAFRINVMGTVNVLEAARSMKVERVVFTSSKGALSPCVGEYGFPRYFPVNENHPATPTGSIVIYGSTKVAGELIGNAYSEQYGLEFIALRFATIYGPGKGAREGAIGIYGKMIENAMAGKPTVIHQGGDEKNDMLYVKDCANSIILACFRNKVKHRLFHIGTGVGYTYHEFADSIRKIYPTAVFHIGRGLKKPLGLSCVMDISRAKEDLGYAPRYSLDEGVRDYVQTVKSSYGLY